MFQREVLIRETLSEDAQTACAIAFHEVSTLNHEILDNPMESAVLVANWHLVKLELSGTELPEILGRLWDHVAKELHLDAADWMATNGNVEKDHWVVGMPLWAVFRRRRSHLATVPESGGAYDGAIGQRVITLSGAFLEP